MTVTNLVKSLGIQFGDCSLDRETLGHAHLGEEKIICVQDPFDEGTIIHEIAHITTQKDHTEKFFEELKVLEWFIGFRDSIEEAGR